MTNKEFYRELGNIDPKMIEAAAPADKVQKKKKNTWIKWASLAACFCLIVSAIIVVPMLRDSGNNPIINPPNSDIPSISTMISGNMITGKQELIYGDPSSGSEGEADMIAPGFEIQTVIEAEVIEVLPDTYYYAASYYEPFHVAKLRVVDQIRGVDPVQTFQDLLAHLTAQSQKSGPTAHAAGKEIRNRHRITGVKCRTLGDIADDRLPGPLAWCTE